MYFSPHPRIAPTVSRLLSEPVDKSLFQKTLLQPSSHASIAYMHLLQEGKFHSCKNHFYMLNPLSTSMHFIHTLVFLAIAFATFSSQIVHTIRCQPRPPPRFLSSFPLQHAGDCLSLLSQVPGTLFHEFTPSPSSLSIPFLPRTYISHKTCSLQINWRFSEASFNVTTPVLEAFSYVAPAGTDLVRECIQNGWDGVAVKRLQGIEITLHLGGPGSHRAWRLRQQTLREFLTEPEGIIMRNSFDTWSWGVWEV